MGNLLGEPFRPYVNSQIKLRQEIHGKKENRSPQDISYLNSKNAFVKLFSGVSLDERRLKYLRTKNGVTNPLMDLILPGTDLAKKYVLFNGLSEVGNKIFPEWNVRSGITSPTNPNGAYGVGGTDFGYSPMPGIISAEIKDLNRGSLKEATINLKVHNKNQFDIIETLYMRLGYSILLEWGVDKYMKYNSDETDIEYVSHIKTIGNEKWFDYSGKSDYTTVLRDIEQRRKDNCGNYDALFGRISNFSWEFSPDGSYTVMIKVFSVGDVIESLNINTPPSGVVSLKQPDPVSEQSFEQIREQYKDADAVSEEVFYSTLYPGLRDEVKRFYNDMKNKGFFNIFDGLYDEGVYNIKNEESVSTWDKLVQYTKETIQSTTVFSLTESDWKVGAGSDKIFSKDLANQFIFRPVYKKEPGITPITYKAPQNLSEEFGNVNDIVREVLRDPSTQQGVFNNPKAGDLIYRGGTNNLDSSITQTLSDLTYIGQNYPAGFFYDILVNQLEDLTKDYIIVQDIQQITPENENVQENESTFKIKMPNLSKKVNGAYPIEEVILAFGKQALNTVQFEGAVKKGFDDAYDEAKPNKLIGIKPGYGAKTAGTLWPGVRSGWYLTHLGLDEFLRGKNATFQSAPAVEEGPVSVYEVARLNNKVTNPQSVPAVSNEKTIPGWNQILDKLIFYIATEEKFLTHIYNMFVAANKAGGEDDDRFEVPDEDEITEAQVDTDAYEQLLEEKRNKNAIFNWFYNIRKMYPLYTYGVVNETNDNVKLITNQILENLPKISLFINKGDRKEFEEIGRIVNPYNRKSEVKDINKGNILSKLKEVIADEYDKNMEGVTLWRTDAGSEFMNVTLSDKYGSDDPNEIFAQLEAIAEKENVKISPAITKLKTLYTNSFKTPSQQAAEWNKKVGFPQYVEGKRRDFGFLFLNPIENSYFVRLGVLLEFLERNVIFKVNEKTPAIKFDTNVETNICYAIDNVISTNITKCLISNSNVYTNKFGTRLIFDNVFENLEDFVKVVKVDKGTKVYGQIMNIYFNFNRVEQILSAVNDKNEVQLFKFLKTLTNDINECTGNVTNIEPVIDKDTNTIRFIDQTTIPGLEQIAKALGIKSFQKSKSKEVTLEVFGYNQTNPEKPTSNFIRNIGLKTEISKEYSAMITIGATANGSLPGSEATALSKWNIGISDRFLESVDSGDAKKGESFEDKYKRVLANYANLIANRYARCGLNFPSNGNSGINFVINYDYISIAQDVMSNYYKFAQASTMQRFLEGKEEGVESSFGFIPFNLSFDMDGISGIKIYNRVKINTSFLPSNYGNSLDFIVSGVNHILQNNEWVTKLQTIATSKYKDGS